MNLELDGHRVVMAGSGPDGIEALRRDPPDIVLLDVMMPGLDGWEVLSQLKSDRDAALASIPVILLTARNSDLDRIRGGIEGAVRYMTKPFSVDELRSELSEALDGEPEPVKRKAVQRAALEQLARLEKGDGAEADSAARPHLTRFESPLAQAPSPPRRPKPISPALATLSPKQVELLTAVASTLTVRQAAEDLGVSRSNVYASLRRIARKLGVRTVPELVSQARQGAFGTS